MGNPCGHKLQVTWPDSFLPGFATSQGVAPQDLDARFWERKGYLQRHGGDVVLRTDVPPHQQSI